MACRPRASFRSRQVPLSHVRTKPEHLAALEEWMRSYRPKELFDDRRRAAPALAALARRATVAWAPSRTPTAAAPARPGLPDFRDYAVDVQAPATTSAEATRVLGGFLRDVVRHDADRRTSASSAPTRPPRTGSARSSRRPTGPGRPNRADTDDHLAPDGRVMEVLSEHLCQGWLEGYLLTGRHGVQLLRGVHPHRRLDGQPAREVAEGHARHPVAPPVASLNYLLTSHVWRQDHNGFSHQDPGFIDHVVNKKAEIVRVYLPPDANCLLSVADHCLRSRDYVNVIVAGKQPAPQ